MEGFVGEKYCPQLFEDETIYSWVSRWVFDCPYPSISANLEGLLGTSNKQLDSSFPSFIESLSKASGISIADLINHHTVLPYFRRFCEGEVYQRTLVNMCSGSTFSTHAQMSLTAGRAKDIETLNFCPECVLSDVARYGIAYWHINHQLPGVSVCDKHGIYLHSLRKRRRAVIKAPQTITGCSAERASFKEIKFSRLSVELLRGQVPQIDNVRLVHLYRHMLLNKGMASISLQIHQAVLRRRLIEYWHPIISTQAVKKVFDLGHGSTYPACLFYQPHANHHPLKHLLMIGMLFDSFEDLNSFNNTPLEKPQAEVYVDTEYDKKVAQALEELSNGYSLRYASRASGLAVSKVKQIAIVNGIYIHRREQKIFGKERHMILQKLCKGLSTQSIAKDMDCCVGVVEQILSSNPEVVQKRKQIRFEQRRQHHRSNLLNVIAEMEGKTRGAIQRFARTSYTWLFKHDKGWLYKVLPKKQKPRYWPRKLNQ